LRNGKPLSATDAWIAATALVQGIPLVTHHPQEYDGVEELYVLSAA